MDDFLFAPDEEGVIARITPNNPRRMIAYVALTGLGALFLLLGMAGGMEPVWILPMIGFGLVSLYQAERLRRATGHTLELTVDEVRDTSGRVLARLEEIASVERGAFALKPSNGFTIILKHKAPLAWAPGIWWRLGRRVGIGGVVSAGQTKAFAEALASKI